MSEFCLLPRTSNQAEGIANYAINFIRRETRPIADDVIRRLELFHVDSVGCGVGAIVRAMNAPVVLRSEAMEYRATSRTASCFGEGIPVAAEKAVLANCSAVRELDANGTNFGYNPRTGQTAGEFGHNDFYPVAVAGATVAGADGATTLRAMLCLDEIRGRLAEAFSLKDHKIDHVVHGGIASAAVYGALVGADAAAIESAIGQFVAHYIPFRAIRSGEQLSDSKGASAAISAEVAVQAVHRAIRGFRGPADIFRNRQAIFCLFEPPGEPDASPFDLELAHGGSDFAICGMHFKLGLYEHQSAGAIQGLIDLFTAHPELYASDDAIERIRIAIYEPAFSIIGDPAKRDPKTRQSADHSMVYIIATLWRKAIEQQAAGWDELMLMPEDYDDDALFHPLTRRLMQRIEFRHGGQSFDKQYPDGIPTQLDVDTPDGRTRSSGLVMYPMGHARADNAQLETLLRSKFQRLVAPGFDQHHAMQADALWDRFQQTCDRSPSEIGTWYAFPLSPGSAP